MTRYAIDCPTALRLVADQRTVGAGHQLVGPAVLRTDALGVLYRDVRAGRLEDRAGRDLLERIAALKIRLLGDRVSRATAWRIAAQLDWPDIGAAEYLAVASLQADALVTEDPGLVAAAAGIVDIARYEQLFA